MTFHLNTDIRISNSFIYILLILSPPTPFGVNKYTNTYEIAVYPVEVDTLSYPPWEVRHDRLDLSPEGPSIGVTVKFCIW